ncbi:adenylosuccinate synthetase [Fusarium globosum]|uniref:Adenylosuccinate synthetase n=1 Tax=Fusarium globosum TaxID=78864 RepID=A0A8H6CXZ7_9HYPO|nr:adenylosuccinate synthetase [Fusarium globosum]
MAITVILGAQWGDEGVSTQGELNTTDDTQALTILQKGKLVDGQCQEAQLCARAAGGHNAGHLVRVNGVSYSFHLLPSGLINPRCPSFFSELKELEKNLTAVHDRILVSDRVNILLDLHIAVDGLEEEELGDAAIGTTRRGMLTPGLHDGLSLSAFFTSSQAFPNLNGVENPSHQCRASDAI